MVYNCFTLLNIHFFSLLKIHANLHISYIIISVSTTLLYRIRQAKTDDLEVVDVDGSYLYKKCQRLEKRGMSTAALDLPSSPPVSGWEIVSETNAAVLSQKLPYVTNGTVYTYLARQTCQDSGLGTFRALTRGYTHWASGRISTISINVQHPTNCHVQSVMKPSMKPGTYHVWLMLQRCDMGYASVLRATCECAAG